MPAPAPETHFDFLLGSLVDRATLRRAEWIAQHWRVPTQEVLICLGWVAEEDYIAALTRHLGLPQAAGKDLRAQPSQARHLPRPSVLAATLDQREAIAIEARSFVPRVLRSIAAPGGAASHRFVLASRTEIARAVGDHVAPVLLDRAVNSLWRRSAQLSARMPYAHWQLLLTMLLLTATLCGLAWMPKVAVSWLASLFAIPFLCAVVLRSVALVGLLRPPRRGDEPGAAPGRDAADLPLYTVLAPVYREAQVLPQLVQALSALDYPPPKLQILLVLEADDTETRTALAALDLPGNFEVVLVPGGGPRTKPKALNYALEWARGEFAVVYDAEDIPEPDQILRALAAFDEAGPSLACVQARLNVYNPYQSWLTRGIMAQTPLGSR